MELCDVHGLSRGNGYIASEWILDKLHNPGGSKKRTKRYTSLVNAKCIIGFQWDTHNSLGKDTVVRRHLVLSELTAFR